MEQPRLSPASTDLPPLTDWSSRPELFGLDKLGQDPAKAVEDIQEVFAANKFSAAYLLPYLGDYLEERAEKGDEKAFKYALEHCMGQPYFARVFNIFAQKYPKVFLESVLAHPELCPLLFANNTDTFMYVFSQELQLASVFYAKFKEQIPGLKDKMRDASNACKDFRQLIIAKYLGFEDLFEEPYDEGKYQITVPEKTDVPEPPPEIAAFLRENFGTAGQEAKMSLKDVSQDFLAKYYFPSDAVRDKILQLAEIDPRGYLVTNSLRLLTELKGLPYCEQAARCAAAKDGVFIFNESTLYYLADCGLSNEFFLNAAERAPDPERILDPGMAQYWWDRDQDPNNDEANKWRWIHGVFTVAVRRAPVAFVEVSSNFFHYARPYPKARAQELLISAVTLDENAAFKFLEIHHRYIDEAIFPPEVRQEVLSLISSKWPELASTEAAAQP